MYPELSGWSNGPTDGIDREIINESTVRPIKKIFVFLMIKKKAGINYRIIEMKNYIIVFSGLILFGFIVQDYLINLFPIIIISFFFFISALSLLIIFHPFTTNDLLQLERICSSSKPLNHLKKYVVKFFNYTAFMRFNVTR